MIFTILFGFLIALVLILNHYLLTYWTRLGFIQPPSSFFVGNAWPLITQRSSVGEFFQNIYNHHKSDKVVGVYLSYKPVLVITDPKLVQDILVKDFSSFHDRPTPVDEENDPLSGHLFSLSGKKWKHLREKLTPMFTQRRVKGMFPIVRRCARVLERYLMKNLKNGVNVLEFRELSARYNTNVISSVAFGIDNDCINEPDHIFRKISAQFFEPTLINTAKEVLTFLGGPKLFHKLKLKVVDQNIENFLFAIFRQTVNYREANNFTRNDFMQLLIQLKNKGFVSTSNDNKEDSNEEANDLRLNMNEIAAQVRDEFVVELFLILENFNFQAGLFFLAGKTIE